MTVAALDCGKELRRTAPSTGLRGDFSPLGASSQLAAGARNSVGRFFGGGVSPAEALWAVSREAVDLLKLRRKLEQQGPPRAPSEPWPFRSHRTLAEILREEALCAAKPSAEFWRSPSCGAKST